jgi:fructose-bisphosphate aldolase, class I
VLRLLQSLYGHGRLANTGYLSILPVDQGVEHSGGASFSKNPDYFDPEKIVELAIEGGCNAVASTFGVLGMVARRYAHRIPFIVKVNHNQLMSYPTDYDQILFGTIDQAYDMGAVAVGATIYFGHPESTRQIVEIAEAFAHAHELGMATVLWCYTRNDAFKVGGVDYHAAADLTGQANHLGVTLQADIVKQKLPDVNGGFKAVGFGRTDARMYDELMPDDHPIEMVRWQVANSYMGRAGLINSGGASGRERLRRRRHHRGAQQARRRKRPHLRPQGVPDGSSRPHTISVGASSRRSSGAQLPPYRWDPSPRTAPGSSSSRSSERRNGSR